MQSSSQRALRHCLRSFYGGDRSSRRRAQWRHRRIGKGYRGGCGCELSRPAQANASASGLMGGTGAFFFFIPAEGCPLTAFTYPNLIKKKKTKHARLLGVFSFPSLPSKGVHSAFPLLALSSPSPLVSLLLSSSVVSVSRSERNHCALPLLSSPSFFLRPDKHGVDPIPLFVCCCCFFLFFYRAATIDSVGRGQVPCGVWGQAVRGGDGRDIPLTLRLSEGPLRDRARTHQLGCQPKGEEKDAHTCTSVKCVVPPPLSGKK